MTEIDAEFEARFAELYPKVLAFSIRRTPSREIAEDIAAETFAVAWRRRDEPVRTWLPWLYGIARQLIRNSARAAGRRERLQARLEAEPPIVLRDPADATTERQATLAAFAALPEADREILMLIVWEELSSTEGARVLGCTRAAFELRLFRARRRLEKELAAAGHSRDVTSPPSPAPASEGS